MLNLHDSLVAAIRTGVAALVGLLAGWLLTKGLDVPEGVQTQVIGLLVILATGLYNWLVIWLETHVNPLFGLLLGVPKTPSYGGASSTPDQGPDDWHLVEPDDEPEPDAPAAPAPLATPVKIRTSADGPCGHCGPDASKCPFTYCP